MAAGKSEKDATATAMPISDREFIISRIIDVPEKEWLKASREPSGVAGK